jgi:hypothetical protein
MQSNFTASISRLGCCIVVSLILGTICSFTLVASPQEASVPTHIPPRRSSQIQNGFGINSDLPRKPYLPWNRWWWTRMADAGVKWIRIGQYENSSDLTSWDWIEQERGVYAAPQGLDDYVNWLVDNERHQDPGPTDVW